MTSTDLEADCAILNLWYGDVHGAVLTAYALQCVLRDLGYTSKLISTMPELYESLTEESYKESRKGGISEQFEAKYLDATDMVYTNQNLSDLNGKYRFFLTGSDQVFRAEWVDDKYFLDFVQLDKPKIAIAASFGTDNPRFYKVRKKKLAYLLSRFQAISVREKSGVSICKSITGKEVTWIADPVFLASVGDYEKLLHPVKTERRYCCCYFRDEDEDLRYSLDQFAKSQNYEIVSITKDTSIEDFLSYIHDADCIITDSYHGLCFSLIFNSPVYCYYNELRGSARFDSLIKMFDLTTEAFVQDHRTRLENIQPLTCFSGINERIAREAFIGKKWIKNTMTKYVKIKKTQVCWLYAQYKLYDLIKRVKNIDNRGE